MERFFRMTLSFRPHLCWIRLLALDLRHLAERMFFARYAKQQHAERNSNNAVAEEKSHNALAQLSASAWARKIKPRWQGATAWRAVRCFEHEDEEE
jgi:hypothetical protein